MANTVLLFTGHLLDRIDRISARFPYRLIQEVDRMIKAELDFLIEQDKPRLAISSLAAGGDIIFAMQVLERGIPLVVFLPFEEDKFLADSVKYLKNDLAEDSKEWEAQFHQALSGASEVIISESASTDMDAAFVDCNQAMLNFALTRVSHQPSKILALALIQNQHDIKAGGAADFVNLLESAGVGVKKIWPYRSNKLYR